MLWVCPDFYICERFTFPAAPRQGMNNGVKLLGEVLCYLDLDEICPEYIFTMVAHGSKAKYITKQTVGHLVFVGFFCQDNYTLVESKCYRIVNSPGSSWKDAKEACADDGGHLAVISDTKTNNELASLMKMNSVSDAWLGAQLTVTPWRWVTGTSQLHCVLLVSLFVYICLYVCMFVCVCLLM